MHGFVKDWKIYGKLLFFPPFLLLLCTHASCPLTCMPFHLLFSIAYILFFWISFYMGWNIKCHGFGNDGVVRRARCEGNAKFCYAFYGFVNGNFWSLRTRKYLTIKVVSIVFTWESSINALVVHLKHIMSFMIKLV